MKSNDKWSRLIKKAKKDRDLALTLLVEFAEKKRFWMNYLIGIVGLYLGVVSIGISSMLLNVVVFGIIGILSVLVARWAGLLEKIENNITRDPVMSLSEKLNKYDEDIAFFFIVACLLLLAGLIQIGLINTPFRP